MNEFRTDPATGRTVIVAPGRLARPGALRSPEWPLEAAACPFCRGRESETPPPVAVYPAGAASTAWQVRVVPNLYPALAPAHDQAYGYHEVVIESGEHRLSQTELTAQNQALVLQSYVDRYRYFAAQDGIKYAQAFKNHGAEAGATLQHTHSQLVALDRIPPLIQTEVDRSRDHRQAHGRCLFCDIQADELTQSHRVVDQTDNFVVFCPFASRLPYEMCLSPRNHAASFQLIAPQALSELSSLLRQTLGRLERHLPNVSYNYLIHSAPFDIDCQDHYHWHIELIPQIAGLAGFEWATGMNMNPMPPEQAARELRSA